MKIQGKKRLAVSPVIATLLLIAIAVAAAIIVYAFVTGLIGGLSTGAGSSLVTITGGISVPTGAGPGTLVLSVKNGASNPIQTVVLTSLTSSVVGASQNFAPLPAFNPFTFTGSLNVGGTASASASYNPGLAAQGVCGVLCPAGFSSGATYTALITVTFSNGSVQTYTYDVTAQL